MTVKRLKARLIDRFPGLTGLSKRIEYIAYHAFVAILPMIGLKRLILGRPFSAAKDPGRVSNFNLLYPAEMLNFSTSGEPYTQDPFLRSCQYIVEGRLWRSVIFTCEVVSAKFLPENGLVFDDRWANIVESVLDDERAYAFRKTFRPRRITKRSGFFSSIQHPWHYNNWHWTADSLAQVRSLDVHMQGRPLTLLMSADLGRVHRDSLEAILPENFTVEYVDPNEWLELATFVLPSHVSSRANAFFPLEYYEFIRSRTFRRLGTPTPSAPTGRYYISRARARHRRVLNEDETTALLAEFGFEKIYMEDYSFEQQVTLFQSAECIVSPHGAGLGGIVYGENLKVCVLYPEARPAGYFYTLALGAGHRHFCTNAAVSENDDFRVDPRSLRRVLTEEMKLEASTMFEVVANYRS